MANKKKDEQEETQDEAPSTQLAVSTFAEMLPEGVDYTEVLDNLREMDEIEFPRIKMKKGKFVLTEDPNDKGVEEFTGVLLYHGRQNTFWQAGFDKNNITPPDCSSTDGKLGSKQREGNKFGTCADCHFNQFKSHPSGKGKACRNQVKLYILRQGTLVPTTLLIAPTSLGVFNRGFLLDQVTQKGLAYWKVTTTFTAYQQDDETFARVKFAVQGVFKGDEAARVKELREFWLTAISRDRTRLDTFGPGDDGAAESRRASAAAAAASSASPAPSNDDESSGEEEKPAVAKKEVMVKPKTVAAASTKKAPVIDEDEEPPF